MSGTIEKPPISILKALDHPELFAGRFAGSSWEPWRAFLAALFGLPLSDDHRAIATACTGLETPPTGGFDEAWLICGRRSGKSRILALIACFLACFYDWTPALAVGEVGTVMVIASDKKQAGVIMRYVRGLLADVPALNEMIRRVLPDEIELDNQVVIQVSAAGFRTVRGYTIIGCLCDEIAFWRSEDTTNPDNEIIDALRPAMATVPHSMLLCASSPYARKGVLWDAWRQFHGKPDAPCLVWHAPTRVMNPAIPEKVIAQAYARDPAWAAAEYGAEFRTDIETFVSQEVVDSCIVPRRFELPPLRGEYYMAFVDPSGGSNDAMTLAIAHAEMDRSGVQREKAVLDAVREVRPPFNPDDVTTSFAALLQSYRIAEVVGDRYGGEWPRERFQTHGISYVPSERPKSDIYREALPILNSRQVELLDHTRLRSQLCSLERRTARGGRDSIDHMPGGHDDVANAAAGAITLAHGRGGALSLWMRM